MKHLKLFETKEEYRQHLAEGGGLTDLPKVALCQDDSTMKYNPKKARKAWFTKDVDTNRNSATYGDTLPLLFSTKGIQSVKINGKILEDFVPPYDEIINYTFEDIINNNTWDGDIFSGITDESGNTIYQMNTPTTILPTLKADDTITFGDDFDIKEYCATVWITDGSEIGPLESIVFNSDRFSSNFVINNNVLSWNTNGELFGIISMYEGVGLQVELIVIPYKYSNPYESNYTLKGTYVRGTAQIMPTEEMFTNAPIWDYYEYEGQTTPQKLPIIEMELEFQSPSIATNLYSQGTRYLPGSILAISDGFFNGVNVIPIKYSLPLFERFEINDGTATPISYTHFEITESVKSISTQAFQGATFTSITIPDTVTEIGYDAFSMCDNLPIYDNIRYADTCLVEVVDKTLTTYTIKEGTRFIQNAAFQWCTKMTSIIIPDSITSIGENAFSRCEELIEITIGSGITNIPYGVFSYCQKLNSITCKATNAPALNLYGFDTSSTGILYYPKGSDYSTWIEALPDGWTTQEMEF